jgi:hypothetical protein
MQQLLSTYFFRGRLIELQRLSSGDVPLRRFVPELRGRVVFVHWLGILHELSGRVVSVGHGFCILHELSGRVVCGRLRNHFILELLKLPGRLIRSCWGDIVHVLSSRDVRSDDWFDHERMQRHVRNRLIRSDWGDIVHVLSSRDVRFFVRLQRLRELRRWLVRSLVPQRLVQRVHVLRGRLIRSCWGLDLLLLFAGDLSRVHGRRGLHVVLSWLFLGVGCCFMHALFSWLLSSEFRGFILRKLLTWQNSARHSPRKLRAVSRCDVRFKCRLEQLYIVLVGVLFGL